MSLLLVCGFLLGAFPAAAVELPGPSKESVEMALEEISSYRHFVRASTAGPPQVDLGRLLFFDPRLSKRGTMSCATCHKPELAWTDGLARAKSPERDALLRNTPSLLTAEYYQEMTWDGKAPGPEHAASAAIENPKEMNLELAAVAARLKKIPAYVKLFSAAFGAEGPAPRTIGQALGAFSSTLQASEDSSFDRFLKDRTGLSLAAQRGLVLYASKAGCRNCHSSLGFTDQRFRNIGVKRGPRADLGRYPVDPREENWEAFRTPTLRNVALTAPYMHDGSLRTLREVIDFYDRGGDDPTNTDRDLPKRLDLTSTEKDDLQEFLFALTSSTKAVTIPSLPLETH